MKYITNSNDERFTMKSEMKAQTNRSHMQESI